MEAISISLTSSSSQTHCKKWTWSRPNSLVSFSKKWTWPRPNSQMSFTTCLDWVVFYRSTPGYQVPCLDWVVFYRSTPRYQVRFSKSVRSFFFVVVIHNTHRQRRKSPPTKTFKRISHLTQPHVYYPCCHTRPWERKTHCLSHFDGPAGERKFSHSSRKCFTCSCAQCICHEWTFFSAHLSVLMKPVEANVNKYVCTAERKYSCVFMDTTHECNALYMYGEALTRAL